MCVGKERKEKNWGHKILRYGARELGLERGGGGRGEVDFVPPPSLRSPHKRNGWLLAWYS